MEDLSLDSQVEHQLEPVPRHSTPRDVKDEPRDPMMKEPEFQTGAPIHFKERIANVMGRLHVRCFIGKEFTNNVNVDNGWFFMNTDRLSGSAGTGGGWSYDVQLRVRWDAPEGATHTTCTPEKPIWGYLEVHVSDEDGRPVGGAAVHGCGGLYETGPDGMADFAILVMDQPCVLDILRRDSATNTHQQAYIRVRPLAENESRTYHVSVASFDLREGESLQFDLVSLIEAEGIPETGIPEVYEPEVPSQGIEDYEERLESSESYYRILQEVYARTPDEERWFVDEAIEDTLRQGKEIRETLDELYAEEDIRQD